MGFSVHDGKIDFMKGDVVKKLAILLSILLTISICNVSFAAGDKAKDKKDDSPQSFYVTPDGNDANPGTKEKPLRSLDGARKLVRKHLDGAGDITVYFSHGEYFLDKTVIFTLEDSGSEKQKVTYKALPDQKDKVVFTSGFHLTGWRKITPEDPGYELIPPKAQPHVYVVDLPKELGLFRYMYDDKAEQNAMQRASIGISHAIKNDVKHLPHLRGEMWEKPETKTTIEFNRPMTNFSFDASAMDLRLFSTDFNINLLPIEKADDKKLITKVASTYRVAQPYDMGLMKPWEKKIPWAWLENNLEGLSVKGKWAVDPDFGKIYMMPFLDAEKIYAPTLTEFVRVEGLISKKTLTDKPVRYLTFEGFTFMNGDYASRTSKDIGILNDWAMVDKANSLMRFRGAEHCMVKNCTFEKSGSGGLRFDLWAQNNTVEGCKFEYLGDGGIGLFGYGPGKKDVNKHNKIIDNSFYMTCEMKWDVPAITIWQSGFNTISGNYINTVRRQAILLAAPRNDVFTPDHPVYQQAWSMMRWREIDKKAKGVGVSDENASKFRYLRGNVVKNNIIKDVLYGLMGDAAIYVSSPADGELNKIHTNFLNDLNCGITGGWSGIYVEDNVHGIDIQKNIITRSQFFKNPIVIGKVRTKTSPQANFFFECLHRKPITSFDNARDHGPLVTAIAHKDNVTPIGTVIGPEVTSPQADVKAKYGDDYAEMYKMLCRNTMPDTNMKQRSDDPRKFLEKLLKAIKKDVPKCD